MGNRPRGDASRHGGRSLGGRDSLRILAACYIVSALGCAFAFNWPALILFRFIGGLGIGGSSVLGPVYIAEIAPAGWRGRLVGCFQINIVVGILAAYLSNYLIGLAGFGAYEWRWQLGIAGLPAVLFLAMLFGIPQSPRWLVTKNRIQEAGEVLQQLRSGSAFAELREITDSIHPEKLAGSESLFQAKYRRPIFLAVSIAMFNQLAGVNAILYYLNDIFAMAGFGKVSSDLQAVAIGAMNLLATFVAMALIDRIGRRMLLLIGSVGLAVCLAGVSLIFLLHEYQRWLVVLLVGYIGFFAVSQGAVIWVFIGEVFPNRVRAKGQALGSSTHWVMNAVISGIFPLLAARSGAYPFVFFTFMVVLQFVVVFFCYPETKGLTLEELQNKLAAI